MFEPAQQRPCQSPSKPKPYAYTYTHLALYSLLLFVSAVLIVLSFQSRTLFAAKSSKPTVRKRLSKREIDSNRIAICIAGETRTFYYPGVHKSILKRAIQPLQREGYKIDVFFIIRMLADIPAKDNKEKVYKAIKLFNATKVVEYTGYENMQNNFDPDRLTEKPYPAYHPPKDCKGKENFTIRFSHALYRTQYCLNVISEYEQEHRFYYHWIYRLRPDIALMGDDIPIPRALSDNVLHISAWSALFDRIVRNSLLKLKLNDTAMFIPRKNMYEKWGAGDQFFSASRQVAQVAFNAFDISDDCSLYDRIERNSESSFLLYLVKNKVPYAVMSVLWEIVRYSYHWSCLRAVQYVYIPNTTSAIRNETCRKFWKENADEMPKSIDR